MEKKNSTVETRLKKLDNQLRSKDMVIKFRSNSLKAYQTAKKDRELNEDDKDTIIVSYIKFSVLWISFLMHILPSHQQNNMSSGELSHC